MYTAVNCRSCAVAMGLELQSVTMYKKAVVYSSELQELCCSYGP